jgi:cystinosin
LIYLGFCKVIISLIKYIPQVIKNYQRKSTKGWSIFNILLDMTGGFFSFAQNIIDTINGGTIISGGDQNHSLNIAKYALSFISIFFDTIFIVQHYCLYPDGKVKVQEEDQKFKLIADSDTPAYH